MAEAENRRSEAVAEPRTRLRRAVIAVALLLVLALPVAYSAVVVPLSPWEQAEVSLALIGLAILASLSRALRPLIIFLSCFASARYFYWRISSTLALDNAPDAIVSLALLGAESYGLAVLFLGYFQTIELRDRTPPPLVRMPTVDVFIPTYNEPEEIVRRTVIGALGIDYPAKRVFVLDDGKREQIRRLAEELGASYKTRPDNRHAKAGNLNHALSETDGELVAIFDADHVPVRGFLRKLVGFFEDGRVALVQSAQHFFNPDPYERNLKLTGRIAPEQTFFYRVVQRGNDFWNSAFFCGSCAVVRRSALQAIGGFRTDTVTEDAHTALELHSRGYRSVYLSLPLAAGLATETFAAHVKQRIRWARGMAQILRLDNPLLKRGLSPSQRLNYFNAMLHFFFGFPRIIMIAAPLTYLLLGIHPIRADVVAVLAYILPHIGLSTLGNSIISQSYRHSFWSEVYEISIAPYTAGVTLLALVNPRLGKFDVTDKGTNLERARFDFSTSGGTLVLLALSVVGLAVAMPLRLWLYDPVAGDSNELRATLINGAWALANLVTLLATACVAYEQPQQRRAPRVRRDFSCRLHAGESSWAGLTVDASEAGVRVRFGEPFAAPARATLALGWPQGPGVRLEAERRWCDWGPLGTMDAAYRFTDVGAAAHRRLVEMIFGGDDGWLKRTYPVDDPLRSFAYMVSTFWRVTEPRRARTRRAPRLRGEWTGRLDGVPARCLAVSPYGALFQSSGRPAGASVRVSLEGPGGRTLEAEGRLVSGPRRRLAVAFEWRDDAALEEFARSLYASFAATLRPPARRQFWRSVRSWARPAGVALAALSLAACGGEGTAASAPPDSAAVDRLLDETWQAYVRAFMQADGRVIDPKAGGITTSEGQSYAMLRAAWVGDRAVFDRAWRWSRDNLVSGVRSDHLMAWKWGRASNGSYRVLDPAFASDADEDTALALLMAWKRWGDGAYLSDARLVLEDLWNQGTVVAGGRRFLLAGDRLCQGSTCRLNPSYAAPYAYRVFARHDPARPWSELVESAYLLLETNADLTTTRLPSDWVLLDTRSGALRAGGGADPVYSYDALRVPWRIALDAALFGDVRADRYLERAFRFLADEWRRRSLLPAIIGPDGSAQASYEAPEMLAAAMPALRRVQPDVAEAMAQRVRGSLKEGLWGDRESYYLQNWAWLGTATYEGRLAPLEAVK